MSTAKYIINLDELSDEIIKNVRDNLKSEFKVILKKAETERLLQEILLKLTIEEYKKLKDKIQAYIDNMQINGTQKIDGRIMNIPAVVNDYISEFKYSKDVYLTGITFSQTGWKREDRWSLKVNKNTIFDNVSIKEVGEHKYFDRKIKVLAKTPISFILHNNSGNSRQLYIDLEYIETN